MQAEATNASAPHVNNRNMIPILPFEPVDDIAIRIVSATGSAVPSSRDSVPSIGKTPTAPQQRSHPYDHERRRKAFENVVAQRAASLRDSVMHCLKWKRMTYRLRC